MTEDVKTGEELMPPKEELLEIIDEGDGDEGSPELEGAAPELTEIEQDAAKQGWVPKDEYKGDPKNWRPADIWLDRGQFFQRIRTLEDKVRMTEAQVSQAHQLGRQMAEAQLKEELNELKQNRREALEEGDLVKAEEIRDEMDDLKSKGIQIPDVKRIMTPPPEHNMFIERNPWYVQNDVLQSAANAIGAKFTKANPNATPADLYWFVEQQMRKELPHLDPEARRDSTSRKLPATETGGSTEKAPKEGSLGAIKRSMSEEDRQIMKTIIKGNPKDFPNEEAYLKQYAAIPDRRR